jgi:hypothetical protein
MKIIFLFKNADAIFETWKAFFFNRCEGGLGSAFGLCLDLRTHRSINVCVKFSVINFVRTSLLLREIAS